MAFEKMTADQLWFHFCRIREQTLNMPAQSDPGNAHLGVKSHQKIGARALKIEYFDGFTLYFLWYDDTNWTLGTKLYRKRPEKQKKVLAKMKTLTNELNKLEREQEALNNTQTFLNRVMFGAEDEEDEEDPSFEQELNLRAQENFMIADPFE